MPDASLEIRPYLERDESQVVALWQTESTGHRPWNDPRHSIARKLKVARELFIVAVLNQDIVGTLMAGYDGHRGWIYSLAVAPSSRRQRIASRLMRDAERRLRDLGCAKINLQVMPGNQAAVALYQSLGYQIEERISMGKPLV